MDNRSLDFESGELSLEEYQRCYSTAEIEQQVFYGEHRPGIQSAQFTLTNSSISAVNTAELPQPAGTSVEPQPPASGLLRFADSY